MKGEKVFLIILILFALVGSVIYGGEPKAKYVGTFVSKTYMSARRVGQPHVCEVIIDKGSIHLSSFLDMGAMCPSFIAVGESLWVRGGRIIIK